MTKSGRQEMAYEHYIRKHFRKNEREIVRAHKKANRTLKEKLKLAVPSQPIISATVESSAPTSDPAAPAPAAPHEKPNTLPGP